MSTLITPTLVARTALATLYDQIVLAQLVWRDFDSDFAGKQGDTVNIRVPAVFESEVFDRNAGVTTQAIVENFVALELDTIRNVTVAPTDEEMTLEISSFESQVLDPMVQAIAQDIDKDLADKLLDAADDENQKAGPASEDEHNQVFRDARKTLSRNAYPTTDRHAVLSPESVSEILGDKLIVRANESGSTNGLREADVGNLFGLRTYESQTFGDTRSDGVAFHRSAVTLAVRPLQAPRGVASSQVAVESFNGLSLRVVYDYNHNKKQDEVSVDILYGIKDTRASGAVELDFGIGS